MAPVTAIEWHTVTTPVDGGGNQQVTIIPASASDLIAMADHFGTLNRETFSRWCTNAILLAGREAFTTQEIYRLMGICAAPEIRAALDRIRIGTDDSGLALMTTFGEQIGRRNFIAQAVASTQDTNEDPENYITRWALMQIMSGIVTVPANMDLDLIPFSVPSLRDCAALLPYYSGKLAVWQDGHPATLRELKGMVQQITTHAGPKPNIKKERVAYVAAMEPTVTYSNESGTKGFAGSRGGHSKVKFRERGNNQSRGRLYPDLQRSQSAENSNQPEKPVADVRRMAWRLLLQMGGDRQKWDKAPLADIMTEILRLQDQRGVISEVTTPSTPLDYQEYS